MTRVVHLKKYYEAEKYLGTFLDESSYDELITEDVDVYKPVPFGEIPTEDDVLLKFRKKVFSDEITKNAYAGLVDAATTSQNRGIAAGPKGEKLNSRDWVTDKQIFQINELLNAKTNKLDIDLGGVQEIQDDGVRGYVWLMNKVKADDFKFDAWFEETKTKTPEEQVKEAKHVFKEYVSTTNYAAQVNSGIAGYYDRYPRIPFCRLTSYTRDNPEKWQKAVPFIEAVSEQFKQLVPTRWQNQKNFLKNLDPTFLIGESVYTTITVNKNWRTAAHRDAGDFKNGFGNLTVLGNSQYDGGYLVFPEYRVAVDVRPGDVLIMNTHDNIHGNVDFTPHEGCEETYVRVSCVMYAREKMQQCESFEIEELRRNFVEKNKGDTSLPFWRVGFNGVYPDMWTDDRWVDYLLANGMDEYVQKNLRTTACLDEFF